MLSRPEVCLLAGMLSLASGCFLFAHHANPQSTPAAGSARVRLYTDSDTVTGVGSTPSSVFVATSSRGVLRYASDASGTPTRMTTREGLPDDHIYAMSVGSDHVIWVATAQGVARLATDRWGTVGSAQPDVGRATAILALDSGNVLLGGSQGLARYDGSRWMNLTNRYQVVGFVRDEGRILVATAQNGVVALADDAASVDEYGTQSGIPDVLVRAVVPVGQRRMWALVHSPSGARLAYYDGHRWFGYTHGTQRARWMGLIPSRHPGSATLLVDGRAFDIVANAGEPLTAMEAGASDQRAHEELHATPFESPLPTLGAGRGRNAPAPPPTPAVRSGPRPRNIPPFGPPTELPDPHSVPSDAPHFGLSPAQGMTPPADTVALHVQGREVYAARAGVGVSRIAGGPTTDFRTRDLSVHQRPLSLATDSTGAVWVVTDDGSVVRFDGERFAHARLDPDDSITPLMFWSHGPTVAAIARVRPNVLGCYRFADGGWQQVSTRRVDLGGPGVVDVRFVAVDDRGRFWVGIRVENGGTMHDRGVVLIDGNLPQPVPFHSRVGQGRRRARNGAARAPDDLAGIVFDSDNHPWFAGVTGATQIVPGDARTPSRVQTFAEAQGVRGDVVADAARGPSGDIYVATPDGIGHLTGDHWDFSLVGVTGELRAVALASDSDGVLWGAGPRGVWRYNGQHVTHLAASDGLPAHPVEDLAIDGENRAWLSSEDGLTIFTRGTEPATTEDTASSSSSGGEDTP